MVLETLLRMGLRPGYEQGLDSPSDPQDYRLPDFTVNFEGVSFNWGHLGMLDVDYEIGELLVSIPPPLISGDGVIDHGRSQMHETALNVSRRRVSCS